MASTTFSEVSWSIANQEPSVLDIRMGEEDLLLTEMLSVLDITFNDVDDDSQFGIYLNGGVVADRIDFFLSHPEPEVGEKPAPKFSAIIKEQSQDNRTLMVSVQREYTVPVDTPNAITDNQVVRFTTPHIGRRGLIVLAVKDALERIKQGDPVGRRLAWKPDTGDTYPMSVNCVLLEPLQPINLQRDNLLPALIVSYGDGIRNYKAYRQTNLPSARSSKTRTNSFNTLNEVEEVMTVMIRAILQPNLESTRELAREGILTGESLTVTTANLHESIDTALGDGLDLSYKGERIEGIKELKVMRWQTPFDMWANDYAILDIPVMITHVFHRGTGV